MKKAMMVEFPGWGFKITDFLTDTQISDAIAGGLPANELFKRPLVGDVTTPTFTADVDYNRFPDNKGGDWTIRVSTAKSIGLEPGVWFDLYFGRSADAYQKVGTFYIVSYTDLSFIRNLTVRAIDLTAYGQAEITYGTTTPAPTHSFLHPYIPRSVSTLPPQELYDVLQAAGLSVGVQTGDPNAIYQRFPWEPIVTDFTTQLKQEIDVRGGIASSSGFTFQTLFSGRESRIEPNSIGTLPRNPDRNQQLENLVSQNKYTWGQAVNPGEVEDNRGIAYRRGGYNSGILTQTYKAGRFVPRIADTGSWWRNVFSGFFGSDFTNLFVASNPKASDNTAAQLDRDPNDGDTIAYEVIPFVFGSAPAIDTIPRDAEVWSTPPTAIGRRVRLWTWDVSLENPMTTADLVYDGYIDDWQIANDSTELSFSIVDVLSWLRRENRLDVVARTEQLWDEERQQFFDRNEFTKLGESPVRNGYDPFTVAIDVKFEEDAIDIEDEGNTQPRVVVPQWIQMGGYAFPHHNLYQRNIDSRFPTTYTYLITQPIEYEGFFTTPQDSVDKYTLYDLDEIFDKPKDILVRKMGIPVDSQEENFDFSEGSLNEGDNFGNGNSLIWFKSDDSNFSVTSQMAQDTKIPIGYLEIPSVPHVTWMGIGPYSTGGARVFLNEIRKIGLGNDAINYQVANVRLATYAYRKFAMNLMANFIQDIKPCHVFFQRYGGSANRLNGINRPIVIDDPTQSPNISEVAGRHVNKRNYEQNIYVSLLEVVLQVLTSTGSYRFLSQSERLIQSPFVRNGINGRYDLLPEGFGLGIPQSLIDVEQLENFSFSPYTKTQVVDELFPEREGTIKLDDLVLQNLVMTWDDAKNPAKWLEEKVLRPYGLVLTSSAEGKLQIRTIDSFDSSLYDLSNRTFKPEALLGEEDLSVDQYNQTPLVTLNQKPTDLIQRYSHAHENKLFRYSVVYPTLVGNNRDSTSPTETFKDASIKLTAKSIGGSRSLVPVARNINLTETDTMASAAFLNEEAVFTNPENPLYFWSFYDAQNIWRSSGPLRRSALIRRYNLSSEVNAVCRAEKINRWQVQRPEIQFEVMPTFPGTRFLTPGSQIFVTLPNIPNIDGSRGLQGIVLLTSVQHDILSGVRIVTGRVVAQEAPKQATYGNYWAMTARVGDSSGVASSELIIKFSSEEELNGARLALQPNNQVGPVRFLDQFCANLPTATQSEREILDITWDINNLEAVVEFNNNITIPKIDIAYIVFDSLGTLLNSSEDETKANNAFFNANWRWQ
jgi:hypothetical protein